MWQIFIGSVHCVDVHCGEYQGLLAHYKGRESVSITEIERVPLFLSKIKGWSHTYSLHAITHFVGHS